MGQITAEHFWKAFKNAVHNIRPVSSGASLWTGDLYKVLHHVQTELDLWCACIQGHQDPFGQKGECLKIDFMWFDRNSGTWGTPVVAIEHENTWNVEGTLLDFWRVCQICTPLRVCIGYARSRVKVDEHAKFILGKAQAANWHRLPLGEDVLILGHGDMDWTEFRAWRLTEQGVTELAGDLYPAMTWKDLADLVEEECAPDMPIVATDEIKKRCFLLRLDWGEADEARKGRHLEYADYLACSKGLLQKWKGKARVGWSPSRNQNEHAYLLAQSWARTNGWEPVG